MTLMATTMADARTASRLLPATLTRGRWLSTIAALTGVSLVTLLICLQIGLERIGLADLMAMVMRLVRQEAAPDGAATAQLIVVHIRLPRILLGFLVGGCLAAVGVGLQALLRNPLADPYVLGISSGASVGAAIAVVLHLVPAVVPVCAFGGGLLALLVLYRLAVSRGPLAVHTLLLGGVIVSALCSALIMFVTSLVDPARAFQIIAWLMGTLSAPDYATMGWLALCLALGLGLLFRHAHALNLLTTGEESARSMGVDVERVKRQVFVVTALLVGVVVSVSGLIGFVGMVVPHAVRMVVGADHRLLLPAAGLVGGALLVVADTVARVILLPAELPVGIVTALIGAPVFLYLLMTRKGGLA
ncbi:MAG: FecCD family ABC transporter permease [Nitrospira sp.]